MMILAVNEKWGEMTAGEMKNLKKPLSYQETRGGYSAVEYEYNTIMRQMSSQHLFFTQWRNSVKLIFGFLRSREIIGQLSDYQLFTEDPGS
jgi:hypothetical protein